MGFLSAEELKQLLPAELSAFPSPIPTQSVSSDEFMPAGKLKSSASLRRAIKEYGSELARHQGMSRRAFFKNGGGYGSCVCRSERNAWGDLRRQPRRSRHSGNGERAKTLSKQFVMDMHTHFLRDDTRNTGFVRQREAVGKAGWNPALAGKPQTVEDLKFANYFKELFLDSDTQVAASAARRLKNLAIGS